MNKKERDTNPGDSFDGGYHLYAEEKHDERVAKNPDRIAYAIERLEAHGIEYTLKNATTGHFHCRRKADDSIINFYAGTGKIVGYTARGIHNLICICKAGADNTVEMTEYQNGYNRALADINQPMIVVAKDWNPSECPRCSRDFAEFEPCDDGYYNRVTSMERCPYCGQKLCWEIGTMCRKIGDKNE